MSGSTGLARAVVDALIGWGVTEAVLCPGSRSGPVAFALLAAAEAGAIRLHVRVDERTAGFLALGLSKASRCPVPVLTTSGTAVANLHPALLEARHAGVRVVALTADRPASLRGTGANQTTDQLAFFGEIACVSIASDADPTSWDVDLDRTGAAALSGPVQLNLELDEPLIPTSDWTPTRERPARADRGEAAEPVVLAAGPRTVVVAGDDAGPVARQLAEAGRWPLLAEPSSGARTGDQAIMTYRGILAHSSLAARIQRVVVFGHPTLSRPVSALLARRDVETIVVGPDVSRFPNAGSHVSVFAERLIAEGRDHPAWLDEWRAADAAAREAIGCVLAAEPSVTPYAVASAVADAVPPGGLLFVGSSNPVRDLDLVAAAKPVGEHRLILANRGLAGIDGTLSSAIGAALARDSTTAIAYIGDLTFLHDANALLIGPAEPRPSLTIVVASDDGGSIFSTLEQGGEDYAPAFERIFGTPTGAHIESLCTAYGIGYERVGAASELASRLAERPIGIRVLEIPLDRTTRRRLTLDLTEAMRRALDPV